MTYMARVGATKCLLTGVTECEDSSPEQTDVTTSDGETSVVTHGLRCLTVWDEGFPIFVRNLSVRTPVYP